MRALVQRVLSASVSVEDRVVAATGTGLLVFLGVGIADGAEEAAYLAGKVAGLRVFEDENGRMNQSLLDTGGEALVVPQFTLMADTRRGNRPGFSAAAAPEKARALYETFADELATRGIATGRGVFQAHMKVHLVNDGPVTILLESR